MEVAPLTAQEAIDSLRLAQEVGEGYRRLPADLQLGFLRDVFQNPTGMGWVAHEALENTAEVMRSCLRWRQEVGAETLHTRVLPREAEFAALAPHDVKGADAWGHPRIWAPVTGWPALNPEIRKRFTPSELHLLHAKRFLALNHGKRVESLRKGRPIMMHCVVIAFEPTSIVSIGAAKWLITALSYEGRNVNEFFFPLSINAPALVVNVPWIWRTAVNLAKQFMREETANKFTLVGADFLPTLERFGVPLEDVPEWVLALAAHGPVQADTTPVGGVLETTEPDTLLYGSDSDSDSDDGEFLTPPSSPRAMCNSKQHSGVDGDTSMLHQSLLGATEHRAAAAEQPAVAAQRKLVIPRPFEQVVAAKSAEYSSRTAQSLNKYVVRKPDNADEHHTACNYLMQMPRPLLAIGFPTEARWREDQVIDMQAQTLVERAYAVRDGLNLQSRFGRWFSTVRILSSLSFFQPSLVPHLLVV